MAGKKGGAEGNSKKAAGQARKADAAAKKAASAEVEKEAAEASKWDKGAKSNGKKEAEAEKKAELARKKAERDALLAEEEKNTPGRSAPKNSKAAPKKTRGLDLSQLEGGGSGGLPALNASGIDNALDALSLAAKSDTKVDRHPERRFKAAYAQFEERRLQEMESDGTGQGLRLNQKKEKIKKEFERSPENPFNQLTARYDASKDEIAELRGEERSKIESRACPHGIFVSLTPGDPSLWSGVIFVRKGPYAPAILRFQISFPDTYPALPPLVTFSTDMFHPLITPLTTYMYSTDVGDGGTASAFDEERLPPGGFSLRHGFAAWFGRGSRAREAQRGVERRTASGASGGGASAGSGANSTASGGGDSEEGGLLMTPKRAVATATGMTPGSAASGVSAASSSASMPGYAQTARRDVSTYEVLRYIRTAFDDEDVLDSVPLEAAGNPGAWHAWRTHRKLAAGKASSPAPVQGGGDHAPGEGEEQPRADAAPAAPADAGAGTAPGVTRRPGEWNWEGVWEERVKKGIAVSLSEGVLFGNAGAADEVINFLNMDDAEVEGTKANLLRTLGAAA
ncbi:hypothetical protein C8A05DRAFT_40903 [Staphylotrichum tortipilum]|uniref:UBC core domain-containing protein n=1 Tax=Staphylotrichum tortipilum TaxID=2831512 RepID=A0AAN6MSG0_9PEZI|nr:hypothetical protein C8A05DRAFT_40903 [Staphylotrichum longicolle]